MTTDTVDSTVTTDQPTDLFDLLTEATAPSVPDGVARYLASQLGFFSASNRNRRSVTMTDALVPGILVNRPDDLAKPADERPVLAAKEFCYQVKTYATEHGFKCYPRRNGATVTFRFTRPGDDSDDAGTDTGTDSDS
jgi:hypothetical protein